MAPVFEPGNRLLDRAKLASELRADLFAATKRQAKTPAL